MNRLYIVGLLALTMFVEFRIIDLLFKYDIPSRVKGELIFIIGGSITVPLLGVALIWWMANKGK